MTAPARYWRVNFRSVNLYDYAQMGVRHMRLFSKAGADLTQVQTVPALADPDLDKVKLLYTFNGNDGTTTFSDLSGLNTTTTPVGNARISVGAYKYGGSSLYLDGSSGLTVAGTASNNIGTQDFTIEFWFNKIPGGTTYQRIVQFGNDSTAGSFSILINQGTASEVRPYVIGSPATTWLDIIPQNGVLNQSQWYHMAVTREGNLWTMWVDGRVWAKFTVPVGNALRDFNIYQNPIYIGQNNAAAARFYGYLDDFRITIGKARYTHTPVTTPAATFPVTIQDDVDYASVALLLKGEGTPGTAGNQMFFDSSASPKTISDVINGTQLSALHSRFGGMSAYFTGGSRITLAGSSDFTFPGDFTVEAWIRPTSSTTGNIISLRDNSTNGLTFRFLSDNRLQAFYAAGTAAATTNDAIALNTWHHVALVRYNGNVTLYLNGVASGPAVSWAGITVNSTVGTVNLGSFNASEYFVGYMDELRVTKGVARYIANFTVPGTAYPEAVEDDASWASVVLLMHMNQQSTATPFTDESPTPNRMISPGGVTLSDAAFKYGATAMRFTGNSNSYLQGPASIGGLGTADFTAEAWVNFVAMPTAGNDWPSTPAGHAVIFSNGTPGVADGCALVVGSSKIMFAVNDNQILGGLHGMTTGAWYHVAVVRKESWFYLYVNGAQVASATYPNLNISGGANFYVGSETGTTGYLNGYVDEFRLSKAKARYQNTAYEAPAGSYGTSTYPVISQEYDGNLVNATTYPLTALVDNDANTVCAFNWPNYRTTQSWRAVKFDFGQSVLPDYLLLNVSSASYNTNSIIPGNSVDFLIQSSDDNVTWTTQTMVYRPAQTNDTDYRLAVVVTSDIYPVPSRTQLGGDGGIYGIVSEDGVALPNRPVMLFERDTFFKIGYCTTDENGGYAFNGLNRYNEYMVMSVDPSGPPYKNALVWDRIKPINTKGNIAPQSAFFARRIRDAALGGMFCMDQLLDTVTYDYFKPNILGRDRLYSTYHSIFAGYQITDTAVGNALKFVKSNRTATDIGAGINLWSGLGTFTGQNIASLAANYANLTFEFIFKAPQATESPLIFMWGGTRDSDDYRQYGYDDYNGYYMRAAGPTLEVTPTAMNVRFPLGARNRSTIRCSAPVVAGQIYHVMLSYSENTYLKLYVNGVFVSEANILGAGRLWGHTQCARNFETWDDTQSFAGSRNEGAIRRLQHLYIGGTGYSYASTTDERYNIPPGYGGSVALAAIYGRAFSDSDVSTFYDSYANWETHNVQPLQSGYMGEVEADNPYFYIRLNDLSRPPSRIETLMGYRDYSGNYEVTTVFNRPPFVSGSTSVQMTNGAARFDRVDIGPTFTAEFFARFTSVTTLQRLFLGRQYNSITSFYLTLDTDRRIKLSVYDRSGTTTTITFNNFLASANTDYHIAVTYDPWDEKKTRLHINGVKVDEQPSTVIPWTYTIDWLGVGCNVSGTGPSFTERVQGDMAEFALYAYPLSTERIAAHYAARNA